MTFKAIKENPIRLVVVDDHPVTREGLAMILDNQRDMEVVAQGSQGMEAIDLYRKHQPDVVVMDVQMPMMNGANATKAILAEFSKACILLLTTYDGDEDIYRGLHAGARGYILKDAEKEEILLAIRTIHKGKRYLTPAAGATLADRIEGDQLTDREVQVLRLFAAGRLNKEIATELNIAEGTVKSHVSSITSKLGVSNRTEATLEASRRGLLRS